MVSGVFFSSLLLLAGDPSDTLAAKTLFGQEVKAVEPLDAVQLEQRKADFQQMLKDRGLVHIGDQVRPGTVEAWHKSNLDFQMHLLHNTHAHM